MFGLLRTIIVSVIVLFVVVKLVPGISYQDDLRVLLQAALVYALVQSLIAPILNILAFPLNLLSFGLFSALINVGLFYAISYIVPAFTFKAFEFPGYISGVFVIPPVMIPEFGTVVVGAAAASILSALVRQIVHE